MQIDKVFVDMDGVLFNFVGALAPLLDMDEHELSSKLFLNQTYDISNATGIKWRFITNLINSREEYFWSSLKPYPWAHDLVLELQEKFSKVYITSDPGNFVHSAHGKLACIRNNFGIDFKNYALLPYKHLLADRHSLLIDDNRNNVSSFKRSGGYAVLFPQPWNSTDAEQFTQDKLQYTLNQIDKYHAKETTS